jgi:hypothetical protein
LVSESMSACVGTGSRAPPRSQISTVATKTSSGSRVAGQVP